MRGRKMHGKQIKANKILIFKSVLSLLRRQTCLSSY